MLDYSICGCICYAQEISKDEVLFYVEIENYNSFTISEFDVSQKKVYIKINRVRSSKISSNNKNFERTRISYKRYKFAKENDYIEYEVEHDYPHISPCHDHASEAVPDVILDHKSPGSVIDPRG